MLQDLFERNRAWAARMRAKDPDFLPACARDQHPEFFWIGCADSRVATDVLCGLSPGDIFVHRNVANVVHASDMNLLAALEYAVGVLGVRHVILCGHSDCGGVRASLEIGTEGVVHHWIEPIRRLADMQADALRGIDTIPERVNALARLNVIEGVKRLADTPILRAAWARRQPVAVHGLFYELADGVLQDLGCTRVGPVAPD